MIEQIYNITTCPFCRSKAARVYEDRFACHNCKAEMNTAAVRGMDRINQRLVDEINELHHQLQEQEPILNNLVLCTVLSDKGIREYRR